MFVVKSIVIQMNGHGYGSTGINLQLQVRSFKLLFERLPVARLHQVTNLGLDIVLTDGNHVQLKIHLLGASPTKRVVEHKPI